jgi:homogentisate 1,2-dioxygenase
VVGWKGTLTVWQLNVRDIRPVLERPVPPAAVGAHHVRDAQPASSARSRRARSRTATRRALKVPFYHSNIDFDEVLFYHAASSSAATASRRAC